MVQSLTMVGPTVFQFDWKKLAEKPSGPGALSGCIANKAFLISSDLGSKVRAAFASSVMHGLSAWLTTTSLSFSEEVNSSW